MPTLRRLLHAPLFAATIALSMALVVWVNGSALAGVWALLWQPLPYAQAERLVQLRIDLTDIDFQVGLSPSMLAALRARTDTFAGAIGSAPVRSALDANGRIWRAQRISADFHSVLGVAPVLGSALDLHAADATQPPLLLSHSAWMESFGGDAGVLGRAWRIGTLDYRIVGVMPPGFAWPDAQVDAWTPFVASADERAVDEAGGFGQFDVSARLAAGVTLDQARATLREVLANSRAEVLRQGGERVRADVRGWREQFSAGHLPALLLVEGAALLLLLIAAINLAGLTLERALARRREYAVHRALGALPRQLHALAYRELLAPAWVGGAIGLLLVPAGVAMLGARGLLPAALPWSPGADWAARGLGLGAGLVALGLAMAMVRAGLGRIAASGDSLRARGALGGLPRSQSLVLVAQLALTVVLAGGAALLLRSAANLAAQARGFDAQGVLLTQVDLGDGAAPGTAEALRARIAALPGVTAVARADMPPFGGAEFLVTVRSKADDEDVEIRAAAVSPEYFDTLRIALLAGEDFSRDSAADAVVIDEVYARRLGGPGQALGQLLRVDAGDGQPQSLRVIGVSAAVRQKSLTDADPHGTLYRPIGADWRVQFLVTRSALDPPAEEVRRLVAQLAPDAELMVNIGLEEAVSRTRQTREALMQAVSLFALATLCLSTLGLYAALAAGVRRRVPEFGVRMALGASPGAVLRQVFAQAGRVLAPGLLIGLGLGLLLARAGADLLYRLAPYDPASWTLTLLAIALVGTLAGLPAAVRAMRVPPTVALAPSPGASE